MRVVEVYGGGGHGGAAQYLRLLLPGLRAAGVDVHFVSLPPHSVELDLPTVRAGGLRQAAQAIQALSPAVVHSHGLKANLAVHLSKAPRVVRTVHSFIRDDYPSAVRRRVVMALDRRMLPRVSAFIVPSHALATDMQARGVPASRLHVVRHGVTPPPEAADRRALLELVGAGRGAHVALVAARLEQVKGVDLAVRAMAQLSDAWHLAIFGVVSQRAALEHLAATIGVETRVHFLGYHDDVRRWLGAADVVVVPSRQESIGLVAVEAMAAGRPLVATDVGGLGETVGRGGLLVAPESPEAMAEGVRIAAEDQAAMAERGLSRYASAFTPDRFLSETLAVLTAAASG